MSAIANTPEPPYFAVIFTSFRNGQDAAGYGATAQRMEELSREMPGYLGIESVRGEDGAGITVSYWKDEESIAAWRRQLEHQAAQWSGKTHWYREYHVRIARVERAYEGPGGRDLQ